MARSRPLRAVLDTNVIIAALKSRNPQSPTVELLTRWAKREFTLLYSDDLLAEYAEKLADRSVALAVRERFLSGIIRNAELVDVRDAQIRSIVDADPDDDLVLACAMVGKATHLVTYDPHLLTLANDYQQLAILDGLGFLKMVRDANR